MGIWGKIGKIALKAAPYAAMAIPGVGVPLGMAIGGATSAASKKAEGGSWKDALIAGGIGAGTSAVGAGALKGIGPTSGTLSKVLGGIAGKTTGTGVKGIVGKAIGDAVLGKVAGGRRDNPYIMDDEPGAWGGPIGGSIADTLGKGAVARGSVPSSPKNRPNPNNFPGANESMGGQTGIYTGNMRGLGPVMGRRDQNVPNFAESIGAGRQDAMRGQPWRSGYDMIMQGPEPADDAQGNIGPQIRNPMPQVYPNFRRKRAS